MSMRLRARLERHLNSIWYDDHATPPLIYRGLERIHLGLNKKRFDRPQGRPPKPVIVVGNLCAGGSGKTPTVIALINALKADYRVAVISRGYGGRAPDYPLQVEPDTKVEDSGDEALLIRRATGVPVWVDPQRARALHQAITSSRADVVISDDGLQHRQLPRSFEICLFDGQRGVGNGHLLPAGPLRQPLDRLDSVDAVLIKGKPLNKGKARKLDRPDPVYFELAPTGFRAPDGKLDTDLAAWAGRSVVAICALANPQQFRSTLESIGLNVELHAFSDHHRYTESDMARFNEQSPGQPIFVTTAKDATKLEPWVKKLDLHVLEVAAVLPPSLITQLRRHISGFS